MRWKAGSLALLCLLSMPVLVMAQQTGALTGKVTDTDGLALPGVTVEARSNVLPTPRVTVTDGIGTYRMPALPPGNYTVTFTLSGMSTAEKQALVQLSQDTFINVSLGVQGVTETVTVTAEFVPAIEKDSTAIKSGVSAEVIQSLPVGQEYRDLIKLIPGVQLTQDGTRGPSAGGSGQDNVYKFDGVNVTLPLFGTLSAEPSSHDIDQVTTIKGGAKAIDFDRAGGFSVDSVSKSGTNRFKAQVNWQFQSPKMASDVQSGSASKYEQTLTWLTVNGGGPLLTNKLFFYGSYYRPTRARDNRSNLYGELPDYSSTRDEGFGKVTYTPTSGILVNATYRYSHRLDKSAGFGQATAPTAGSGSEAWQRIATADGSWVISSRSFASFKYTHYENPTQGRPDNIADVDVNLTPGTVLDLNNLDKIGQFSVPTPIAGNAAWNALVQPLIDRYGYSLNGVKTGGGTVGYATLFDKDDFYRDQAQFAYNIVLGSTVRHDLHAGVQWYVDSEDLKRSSNGWGTIAVAGGRFASIGLPGQPAYYYTAFQQQTIGLVPVIHSEYRSKSIEINDTIAWKDWSFNLGLLLSNDTLYGQDLKEDSSALSGYVLSKGTKYKMYQTGFGKMVQPRVGATWAYNGQDTVYASFARYNPAASSLPRAASWARNSATTINAYFDQNGILYGNAPVASSSGKLFVPDMTPRRIDEFLLGTSKQFNPTWTARVYFRYRRGSHFWEDTNNNARVAFAPPDTIGPDNTPIPKELYIPNLDAMRAQIGSGSTYVIAELDGAFTRYHEVTMESEWRTSKSFVRGSYTWSRYYGNFDQDNSTTGNDANIFIGSSNIADGAGRQLWDFKEGTLRGDRPHSLKLYGYYLLRWNASVGTFILAQSGQPWEAWNYEPYRALTTSTSETNRYAEPAGSRRTPAWFQWDLSYTQNLPFAQRHRAQVVVDLYNVTNTQTGYNYNPAMHSSTFGQPRSYLSPRRIQVSFRLQVGQ
ncbi:MAG: carboxypeptidase regulatory-like domain-containing protein [Acidobacteriota bacterium]